MSIRPIEETLTGTTHPGQSEPGGNSNKGALHILPKHSIF